MTQIEKIYAEIEKQLKELAYTEKDMEMGMPDYDSEGRAALYAVLSLIESLEKEQKGKTNPLSEECVAKADPATMKEVSDNVDKIVKVEDIQREWYNKGYIKGRKEAHIPARELGLPSLLDDDSPKIKGWVARDAMPRDLNFYTGDKPILHKGGYAPYWMPINGNVFELPLELQDKFEIEIEDEPIEVELIVNRI